jgi:hypothetical protein
LRASTLFLLITCSLILIAPKTYAAVSTDIPVSAELGTSIAADLFPITLKLPKGNLFLTNPMLLFLDKGRIGMQVRIQAYDHRPTQSVAISELGHAVFSGKLDYDPGPQQILFYDPKIDKLEFDRKNTVTERLMTELNAAWSAQVTNPIRSELPPHPYLLPFKKNIQGLAYDGKSINLTIFY